MNRVFTMLVSQAGECKSANRALKDLIHQAAITEGRQHAGSENRAEQLTSRTVLIPVPLLTHINSIEFEEVQLAMMAIDTAPQDRVRGGERF